MNHPKTSVETAEALYRTAVERQSAGALDAAISLYHRSIRTHETAAARTSLGWALSILGDAGAAIQQCLRAIELDPDRGNAYNDIGTYLVTLRREEESIVWFERAKEALVYDSPELPFLNLARLRMGRGELDRALIELQAAGLLAPADRRWSRLTRWIRACLAIREESQKSALSVPLMSA